MGKLFGIVLIAALGYVGYRLLTAPPPPKEQTLKGYTERLQTSREKAEGANRDMQLRSVKDAVNRFRVDQGRLPGSLPELVERGFLDHVPEGIEYDPTTGEVR